MATLSTVMSSAGVSGATICDPVKRTTTIQVTVASGSSGSNIFAQYTLDDPSVVGASSTNTWANLSSAIVSSNADGIGVTYTMVGPIGGLRLSSTTTVTGAVTLKALQSVLG